MAARPRTCPYCHADAVARVVHGTPTTEPAKLADTPDARLGLGAGPGSDGAAFGCRACGTWWPSPHAELQDRYPLPGVRWPSRPPRALDEDRLRDLVRGSLLWGAVGDALGRPNETRPYSTLGHEDDPGFVRTFQPWHGWQGGPTGTITDDTQLTVLVARALARHGGLVDPDDLSRDLVAWLPEARGAGRATRAAVALLEEGRPWWEVGPTIDSAGNGAAMPAAPVGLAHALDPSPGPLCQIAVTQALPTHAAPVGVAGAVAMAAGVGAILRLSLAGRALDPVALVGFMVRAIVRLEAAPSAERKPPHALVYLRERLAEVPDLLRDDPAEVLAYTWTGAFALESVPAAVFCFLRASDDPAIVLLTAANTSHDTDTIASMAGQLVGARVGAERLRREHPEWWTEVEFRDELTELANELVALRAPRDAVPAMRDRRAGGQ